MLMPAYNLPQTAPDTIANYRAADAARRNEAHAAQAGILDGNCAQHKQFATVR
jgi:hypothetical protein